MAGIRRAFLLTSLERYIVLAVNFGVIAVVSRLLTPTEVGIAVLGNALLAVAETLRDFGTGTYLIQHRDVSTDRVRTAFTVMVLVSGAVVAVVLLAAEPVALLYGEPLLADYLRIIALAFLAGPISAPILALMRRDMAFGAVATVNVVSSIAGGATTLLLVLAGHGAMSFAWGGLAWCVSAAALALALRPDTRIFRLHLSDWREALAFGGVTTAMAILNRFYEVLPYLALGRMQPASDVGLYNRATLLCQMPDRTLLYGVLGVALPALAAEARAGRPLKDPYLRALAHLTAVQWPALLLIALLAHPAVLLLFGAQWLGVVPLVQIMAVIQLCAFPAMLTYPVLIAAGAAREMLWATVISLVPSAAIIVAAAHFGAMAVAASMLLVVPLQVGVALRLIRRRIGFTWAELVQAVAGSAAVAGCAAVAPAAAIALNGFSVALPFGVAVAAGLGAALGWGLGLWLTAHPLGGEVARAAGSLRLMQRRALVLAQTRVRR